MRKGRGINMTKTFQDYYRKAPVDRVKALQKFRQHTVYRTLIYKGVNWTYYSAGSGKQVLMIIPGGLRKAESIFQELQLFQDNFRILSLNIPFLMKSDDIIDGLLAILHKEKIDRINILGRSFGGSLAQGFTAKYPDIVQRLIICSTVYSDESYIPKTEKAFQTYRSMSEWIARLVIRWAFYNILKTDIKRSGRKYWKAYLNELLDSISVKNMMLSQLQIGKDLILKHPLTKELIARLNNRILIIYAKNDKVISEKDHARYAEYFPQAKIKIFNNGGHLLFETRAQEYFETIRDFLSKE